MADDGLGLLRHGERWVCTDHGVGKKKNFAASQCFAQLFAIKKRTRGGTGMGNKNGQSPITCGWFHSNAKIFKRGQQQEKKKKTEGKKELQFDSSQGLGT